MRDSGGIGAGGMPHAAAEVGIGGGSVRRLSRSEGGGFGSSFSIGMQDGAAPLAAAPTAGGIDHQDRLPRQMSRSLSLQPSLANGVGPATGVQPLHHMP